MIWHNIGAVKQYTSIIVLFYICVQFKAFQIFSSIDLMTPEVVFRLVIKYATSPKVLKCTPNGIPPGAAVKLESA